MKLIKYIACVALGLITVEGMSQTAAVQIGFDSQAPDPSAMLDVNNAGQAKGALIPRVTYLEMLNILPVQDGLTVYVTDGTARGFWYWDSEEDHNSPTPEGKWLRLQKVGSEAQNVLTPLGGIIMYVGDLSEFDSSTGVGLDNTRMEGWALCIGGSNGTPDLRGKFVVGAKNGNADYGSINNIPASPGQNVKIITEQVLPNHRHILDPAKTTGITMTHTHAITDPGHSHNVNTTHDNNANVNDLKRRSADNEMTINTDRAKTNFELKENVTPITFKFPTGFLLSTGEGQQMENRPNFYVVAFIMRTDGGTYNVAQPFGW